ncbi:MAG TPA: Flp pilus assembly protein CpaB [Gemmatimonadaceae bacterium]|nr:Flp pilus assembly protein CpaB [Gemmatimonadaceae bacterium]
MAHSNYKLVLYSAVAVAALATMGAYKAIDAMRGGDAAGRTRPVVVATRELAEGTVLEASALSVKAWPADAVPEGAFASVDSLVGRVAAVSVLREEPVRASRLAPVGSGAGLQVKITPGRRAMAVKIDEVAGLSGMIQPNSRVDVLVTLRTDPLGGRQVAKLFMENMRVLSVGTTYQNDRDGKPISATTATLEVTPEEAERLAVAANQGTIQLVLRGYGDPDTVRTRGASSADVLAELRDAPTVRPPAAPRRRSAPRPAAPAAATPAPEPAPAVTQTPPAPPDSLTVRIYRGANVTQQKFERDTAKKRPPR